MCWRVILNSLTCTFHNFNIADWAVQAQAFIFICGRKIMDLADNAIVTLRDEAFIIDHWSLPWDCYPS